MALIEHHQFFVRINYTKSFCIYEGFFAAIFFCLHNEVLEYIIEKIKSDLQAIYALVCCRSLVVGLLYTLNQQIYINNI